jgi:hypothetical protein
MKIKDNINNFGNIEIGIINKNNINNYIIEPRYEEYIEIHNENKIMLWTVFESDDLEYKIVYSEKDEKFGLATISMEDEKNIFRYIWQFSGNIIFNVEDNVSTFSNPHPADGLTRAACCYEADVFNDKLAVALVAHQDIRVAQGFFFIRPASVRRFYCSIFVFFRVHFFNLHIE